MFPYPSPLLTVAQAAGGGGGSVLHTSTITIASGVVGSNLSNFPVYVDLDDLPAGFWSNVASDGGNIRMSTNSDGTVTGDYIPADPVKVDTGAGTGRMYFKASSLLSGSNNVYYLHIVSGATLPASGNAIGRNAVWSNFHRVIDGWENQDRTGAGAMTLVSAASFGSGTLNTTASPHGAYIGISAPTDFTVFTTCKPNSVYAIHSTFLSVMSAWTATPSRITLARRSTGNFATWNNTNSWSESSTAVSLGSDYTVALAYDAGGTREIFVNGASILTAGSSATIAALTGAASPVMAVGIEDSSAAETLSGNFELMLMAQSILSANYIAALHNNRRNRGSFYAIT